MTDRPYAASSFLSVALARVFSPAMAGRCQERPELVSQALPMEISLPVVPCTGGDGELRRLFEPLGYTVTAQAIAADDRFPAWGNSRYLRVQLGVVATVKQVLQNLFVLLPVLDDEKHSWVGPDEVEKLLRRGDPWLASHPERQLISDRYLRHVRELSGEALTRLAEEDPVDPDLAQVQHDAEERVVERPYSLSQARVAAVIEVLTKAGARRILDLGCGEGRLCEELLKTPGVEQVVGLDVSHRVLEWAAQRLHLDNTTPRQRRRISLLHGSLTYRDRRLEGYDAAAVVEVIEHLDPWRLSTFERVVFGTAQPPLVVVTTPNVEYNASFGNLPAGDLRHRDHRFEWSRQEFADWSSQVANEHHYQVTCSGIGPADPQLGAPTQMAVFRR